MTNTVTVKTLTNLANNFLMTANGLIAVGKLSSEDNFRINLQDYCESIGLARDTFDHIELDEHLKEAQALPVEVQEILDESTADKKAPTLTIVH